MLISLNFIIFFLYVSNLVSSMWETRLCPFIPVFWPSPKGKILDTRKSFRSSVALPQIRICFHQCCNSMTYWCGSRSGSCYFRHCPSRRQQKTIFYLKFSCYYFLKVHFHNFSKINSQKEVTKQYKSRFFFLLFLLDDRRILAGSRIRIHNSD